MCSPNGALLFGSTTDWPPPRRLESQIGANIPHMPQQNFMGVMGIRLCTVGNFENSNIVVVDVRFPALIDFDHPREKITRKKILSTVGL